jgi:hypothetical protein
MADEEMRRAEAAEWRANIQRRLAIRAQIRAELEVRTGGLQGAAAWMEGPHRWSEATCMALLRTCSPPSPAWP